MCCLSCVCFHNVCVVADLKPGEIHSVEVVGGSSRIPVFKRLVKEVFGLEPSTTLNSDEATARGCALQVCISHSSQCSTTGLTKAVVCTILSVGWCI